jgi:hypothetical protein
VETNSTQTVWNPPVPEPDPFNVASLKLTQDFAATGGVHKLWTTVPARKPTGSEWFQLHPGEQYTVDTLVLELKEARECYLIAPQLRSELATEPVVSPRRLFFGVTRQNSPFVWAAKLPGPDGRTNSWTDSALQAAAAAMNGWVRMQSDTRAGYYLVYQPRAELPPPQWPEMPFSEILRLAFRHNYIDRMDHVVLRQLWGEI